MKNNCTFVVPAPVLTKVGMGAGMTIKVLDDLNLEMALPVKSVSQFFFTNRTE